MALYAYKEGLDPCGKEWRQDVESLRAAVKRHNAPFAAAYAGKVKAEAELRRAAKLRLAALGSPKPKKRAVNRMMRTIKAGQ